MASANGTRTACAQYRTATTSTPPANVNQSFTDFNVSSTFVLRFFPPSCRGRCSAVDIVARKSKRFPDKARSGLVVAELADARVFSIAQTLIRVARILLGANNG